jgi:predicted phage tail protein
MANLKGGNFQKQIKDAFHRLESFGVGRVGKNDNLTHSDKLAEKRNMYLKDISDYFTSQNLNDKLNTLFTKDNLDKFFNDRFKNLSIKTKENYIRGFSSMLKGLDQQNIYIPIHSEDKDFFNDRVEKIKDQAETIIENRYIDNVETVISNLYQNRAITGLIAECQYNLSIRQEEAFELVSNPLKYIENGYIENLVGKGNHIYEPKEISFQLEQKLLNNQEELISKSTYYYDLQKYNISSHNFRFTSARDKFEQKLNSGISEKEAKLQISETLNHKREAITDYYLKRTE